MIKCPIVENRSIQKLSISPPLPISMFSQAQRLSLHGVFHPFPFYVITYVIDTS